VHRTGVFAFGMMATLVRQYSGTSVTGQSITVCVYAVNGQQFERYLPFAEMCPLSIDVQ
jgi:hypothetical protein